jgi:hypothetical protein
MANYTVGPYLFFPKGAARSATFQQIKGACTSAQEMLGDGYVLQPEAITEGGICFVEWPGKRRGEFKTVRFITLGGSRWPNILNGEVSGTDEYVAGVAEDTFGPDRDNKIATLLKAFHGAPVFTTTELWAVMSSLALCYEGCRIMRMPSNIKLQRNYKAHKTTNLAQRLN